MQRAEAGAEPPGTRAASGGDAGQVRRAVGRSLLVVWALCLFVVASGLMVSHWFTMPRPETGDPELRRRIAAHRLPSERGGLFVVHVLYSECTCSQRVLDHLVERRALPNVHESVVLVDHHAEFERLGPQAGFRVSVVTPQELSEAFGLQAAPLFVVADAEDQVRYLGGYTERKQGYASRDVSIIQSLQKGEQKAELPLFGCAVSQSLQEMLDPLRLKYSSTE